MMHAALLPGFHSDFPHGTRKNNDDFSHSEEKRAEVVETFLKLEMKELPGFEPRQEDGRRSRYCRGFHLLGGLLLLLLLLLGLSLVFLWRGSCFFNWGRCLFLLFLFFDCHEQTDDVL